MRSEGAYLVTYVQHMRLHRLRMFFMWRWSEPSLNSEVPATEDKAASPPTQHHYALRDAEPQLHLEDGMAQGRNGRQPVRVITLF